MRLTSLHTDCRLPSHSSPHESKFVCLKGRIALPRTRCVQKVRFHCDQATGRNHGPLHLYWMPRVERGGALLWCSRSSRLVTAEKNCVTELLFLLAEGKYWARYICSFLSIAAPVCICPVAWLLGQMSHFFVLVSRRMRTCGWVSRLRSLVQIVRYGVTCWRAFVLIAVLRSLHSSRLTLRSEQCEACIRLQRGIGRCLTNHTPSAVGSSKSASM